MKEAISALMAGGFILFAATGAAAQPAVQVYGGLGASVIWNASEEWALPTDASGLVPAVGVVVSRRDGKVGVRFEVEPPKTLIHRVPGALKFGPVTYVIRQRNLILSALLHRTLVSGESVRLDALGGMSFFRNEAGIRYAHEPPEFGEATGRFGWSGGADIVFDHGPVVVAIPRLRVHYVTGRKPERNGFAPGRILCTVGAAIGMKF